LNGIETFSLGPWLVDTERLTCTRGNEIVSLAPKHMAVLCELAKAAPAIVRRSRLLDCVWPRGFVNPNVLNNAVSRLRRDLDTDGDSIIETIPRLGYRLREPIRFNIVHSDVRWKSGSPYRGLEPFHSHHSSVFFGRSREVVDILSALKHQLTTGRGFVLLIGASGVGKTSLIDAGVVPALCESKVGTLTADWRLARFKAGSGTTQWSALANALLDSMTDLVGAENRFETLAEDLERDPQEVVTTIIGLLDERGGHQQARILLIMDHLEVLLADRQTSERNEPLFAAIHEMARTGRFWVIAGLRSDFYQEYSRSPALTALKGTRGQYDVSAPGAEQIAAIVREPAMAAGLTFARDPDSSVSLDSVLQANAMRRPDVLPLLQFTLDELYNRRSSDNTLTYEAYAAIGGLEGSMAQRAEQIYSSLDEDSQAELATMLGSMVRLTGDDSRRYSREFALIEDLVATNARKQLLEKFVTGRLFVTDRIGGCAVVSVAHESLFQHWDRARQVLEENWELLAFRRRLSDSTTNWEVHERSDRYLLGVGPLDEAQRLLGSDTVELSAPQKALVELSQQRADRSSSLRRVAIGALFTFAIIATFSAGMATLERRSATEEAERSRQTTSFLVDLFELASPGRASTGELTARQVLDLGTQQLSGQLNRQPAIRSALLFTIGTVYMSLGIYDEAEPLLTSALEIRQSAALPATQISESMNSLGKLDYYRGQYAAAAKLYTQAQELLERSNETDSPEYATTLNNAAEVDAARGAYGDAIEKHKAALLLRRKLFGEISAETGTSLQNLGGVLRRNGDTDAAETHYREAIVIHETFYGVSHPEVAVALSNLGLLLTDSGRFDEAKVSLDRALAIRRKIFGNKHRHTANSLHNLSALLFRQGNYELAEPLFRESIALHRELFGETHDAVAYGRNNLATLLLETGDFDEAGQLFEQAFAALSTTLGTSHPNTALIRSNLAKSLLARGKSEAAMEHLVPSLEALSAALPENHWRLAVVKGVYGSAFMALGDYEAAEDKLLQSWTVLLESQGQGAKTTQTVISHLVELYRRTEDDTQRERFELLIE
jgi:tetratricopeptide (TPR) repeat protein/DNA-binding winged helix-turn-helix (wHTH) protein